MPFRSHLQVRYRPQENLRRITEDTETVVARWAKQPPNRAGRVVVIDHVRAPVRERSVADSAPILLPRQHRVEIGGGHLVPGEPAKRKPLRTARTGIPFAVPRAQACPAGAGQTVDVVFAAPELVSGFRFAALATRFQRRHRNRIRRTGAQQANPLRRLRLPAGFAVNGEAVRHGAVAVELIARQNALAGRASFRPLPRAYFESSAGSAPHLAALDVVLAQDALRPAGADAGPEAPVASVLVIEPHDGQPAELMPNQTRGNRLGLHLTSLEWGAAPPVAANDAGATRARIIASNRAA